MLPIAVALAAITAAASTADARPRPSHAARKRFESNKGFGLGLELGFPSGITGKYWLGDSTDRALDFGIGYTYDYAFNGDRFEGIYLYADYLFHLLSLASTDSFELPFYIGVGPQFWSWTDYNFACPGPGPTYCGGSALGVRVPIGIAFDLNNVPLDIFLQFVPNVDLFFGYNNVYNRGSFELFLNGSVGIRYYFN